MQTRRQRRGANAIEFAVILPVFLSLLLGMIELGFLFYQRAELDAAVAIGCRSAALVDPGMSFASWSDVQERAEEKMMEVLGQDGSGCEDDCGTSVTSIGAQPNRTLVCELTREYAPLIGLVDGFQMTTRTVTRMEWQR